MDPNSRALFSRMPTKRTPNLQKQPHNGHIKIHGFDLRSQLRYCRGLTTYRIYVSISPNISSGQWIVYRAK